MRTIIHEMEILASGGGGRARNNHLTGYFPIILRESLKKVGWAFLEGFAFSDSYVTLFNKSLHWMPRVIVIVLREAICFISHKYKRLQCHDCCMLSELLHYQTLSWTCLPQVCFASQSFQISFHLPSTYPQMLNMWKSGATIFCPSLFLGSIPFGGHQKILTS